MKNWPVTEQKRSSFCLEKILKAYLYASIEITSWIQFETRSRTEKIMRVQFIFAGVAVN